jgi:hypothetical protein
MTAAAMRSRLDRARRTLAVAATVRAIATAVAVACGVLLVLALVDAVIGLPMSLRRSALPLAIAAAAVVLTRDVLQRVRPAFTASMESVALWFEQRLPSLRYALVTAVEADVAPLLGAVSSAPLEQEVSRASRAALKWPLAAAVLGALALFAIPDGALARVAAPQAGDALDRAGAAARAADDPLATIVVRVRPPAYTGLSERTVEDPSAVSALAGSRLTIEGLGAGVRAAIGDASQAATAQGDRWRLSLVVPAEAMGVRLQGPARERMLVIESIADSVPTARLELPARDSVLRRATGTVTLAADVRDDIGLADAAFEYIVSSGAGETFTFRGGRIAARTFDAGTTSGRISGSFALDTLELAPGDLVHLRAVARDRNDVSGAGVGASETRTLRIARAEEYDSVSVDPMPPSEPEKNALSQRMLLQLTQELRARERRIGPEATTRESRRIAVEQNKLRKRVGEIVFTRLGEDQGEHAHFAGDGHEHGAERPVDPDQILAAAERAASADPTRMLEGEGDESPIVAINRPLLEAYNHMWQASTELETGSPRGAIPWMERAIEALQRARAAERIYLRGRPPRVVVDIERVRGTGKEKGAPKGREARAALDPDREARLTRFDGALATVARDPLAAADSLLLLRLSLPREERVAAEALTAAADAVRRGGDVTAALQRARRALAGAPSRADALGPWGM